MAYFYGEEGPLTAVFGWKPIADAPEGYGFDFVNSDVILHELSVKDGRLVTPGGTSYRILYLGGRSQRMTLPVLRKLESWLSRARCWWAKGRWIRPAWRTMKRSFSAIADQLWGKNGAETDTALQILGRASHRWIGARRVGRGFVFIGLTANEALAQLGVARDLEYTKPEPDTNADVRASQARRRRRLFRR